MAAATWSRRGRWLFVVGCVVVVSAGGNFSPLQIALGCCLWVRFWVSSVSLLAPAAFQHRHSQPIHFDGLNHLF